MRKQSSLPIYRRETERKDEKMKEQSTPSPSIYPAPAGLLRLPQVKQMIGVSGSTIWQWSRDGKFPKPVKLGTRTTAWRHSDVLAFLENLGG